jgi:hypothetical protein
MPKLVSDAGRIVMLSLSFWMQAAGILVLIIPELRFRFTGQDYDRYLVWWLSMFFLIAGKLGRALWIIAGGVLAAAGVLYGAYGWIVQHITFRP